MPRQFRVAANDEGRAILTWAVPTDDGGAPIDEYEYRYAEGTTVPPSTMWTSQKQEPADDPAQLSIDIATAIADNTDNTPVPSKVRTAVLTGLTTGTRVHL